MHAQLTKRVGHDWTLNNNIIFKFSGKIQCANYWARISFGQIPMICVVRKWIKCTVIFISIGTKGNYPFKNVKFGGDPSLALKAMPQKKENKHNNGSQNFKSSSLVLQHDRIRRTRQLNGIFYFGVNGKQLLK